MVTSERRGSMGWTIRVRGPVNRILAGSMRWSWRASGGHGVQCSPPLTTRPAIEQEWVAMHPQIVAGSIHPGPGGGPAGDDGHRFLDAVASSCQTTGDRGPPPAVANQLPKRCPFWQLASSGCTPLHLRVETVDTHETLDFIGFSLCLKGFRGWLSD